MAQRLALVDGSSARSPVERAEDEFAKDIWDVAHIPGACYADYDSQHLLNFTGVPAPFRPTVKAYVRTLLIAGKTQSLSALALLTMRAFLVFWVARYPQAGDLHALAPSDVEAYIAYLKATPYGDGRERTAAQINRYLQGLAVFLRHLHAHEDALAPVRPVEAIIWAAHRVREDKRPHDAVKCIPESVLLQLDQHLCHLPDRVIPIVLLLRASGWRISDVLSLRYDRCLERGERGWFLCGDIHKTRVLGHKVPISDEVATMVTWACEQIKHTSTDDTNPKRYLFLAPNRYKRAPGVSRPGRPPTPRFVTRALDKLAATSDIRGPEGAVFHFTTHAFRHTKAMELINNGMSLVAVQQWMAHASPEMTLVYAKLLDSTMQRQWEQAMAQGAVRITPEGAPYAVQAGALTSTGDNALDLAHVRAHLDAIRLPHGYCFKHHKFDCPAARMPCYTCPMFATTPQFLPQFEREISDTAYQVELGEAAGRPHWAEANRRKLTVLQPIVALLRQGQTHHALGKAQREYTTEEYAERARSGRRGQEGTT